MIFMRSGKTGSGKSYDAVLLAYQFWRDGWDVWSNTPLYFTTWNEGKGGQDILQDPGSFTYWERFMNMLRGRIYRRGRIDYFDTIDEVFYLKNSIILFDEGQTLFRNYDWEQVPRLFLQKLEQNRKHELHLITTAQRVKAVNINYRELIQDWAHFETVSDMFGFHIYRKKIKDVDYITENLQEANVPTLGFEGFLGLKIIAPWSKRLYDTMYDIGFEPLQHYKIRVGEEVRKLHLESGLNVKQAVTMIKAYRNVIEL